VASTRSYGGDGAPLDEQSLGELVATATRDLSVLIRQEIELAKAEIAEQAKRGAIGAGLLSGAGVLALLGLLMVCFSASFAIAEEGGLPIWSGFLIVAGFFIVVGGALGMIGVRAFSSLSGPDRTKLTVKRSLASIRHPRQSPPPAA
jgi:hypothetical protein